MKPASFLYLLCSIAGLALTGCDGGVPARIQEKASVFNALTPEQQDIIRHSAIDAGFTTDMVYIALGKPSRIHTQQSPQGPLTVWTYSRFYPTGAFNGVAVSYEQGLNTTTTGTPGFNPTAAGRFGISSPESAAAVTNTSSNNAPTTNGPTMAPEPADLPADTLFVYFYQGQVVNAKLESQM